MPTFTETTTVKSMDPPIGIHIILHGLSKEVIIDIYFGEHEYDSTIPFESLLGLDGQKLAKLKGTVRERERERERERTNMNESNETKTILNTNSLH